MEDDLDKTLDEHWYVDLKGKESIEAQGNGFNEHTFNSIHLESTEK